MARSVLNKTINPSTPYTVPAGKTLIYSVRLITQAGAGQNVLFSNSAGGGATFYPPSLSEGAHQVEAKPLVAAGGDVLSVNLATVAISGFLYD